MQASSAISFRLPPASFSADAWPGSPLTFCFPSLPLFRFCLSLGFRFHDRLSFPLLFLTPAVFAFFRPLQFWVLTTQPLFLLFSFSSRFRLTVASSLLLRFFRCSSLSSSFQADFSSLPVDFAYSASLYVSFRSSLLRSHSRFTGACLLSGSFRPLISDIRPSCLMLSFVRFRLSGSSYSAFSLFRSASSQTHLAPAFVWCPPLLSSLRFPRLPSAGFPSALHHFCLLGPLPRFLSSFPTSLPQPFRWCLPLFLLCFLSFFFRHSSFASVPFRSLPL